MEATASQVAERLAKVVALDGSVAWLEAEQIAGCGNCASPQSCAATNMGRGLNRLMRRFPLTNHPGLKIGDRVIVGVCETALIKASLMMYALPLAIMFVAGFIAQWSFGSEGATIASSAAGLLLGFGIAHLWSGRLSAAMSPRFLRRAAIDDNCSPP